jgi:hypothetical protein
LKQEQQKNLLNLGRAGIAATGPSEQKFFAPLFCKKAAALLFRLKPITLWPGRAGRLGVKSK